MSDFDRPVIVHGNSNIELARKVADLSGIRIAPVAVSRFADGEVRVQIDDNLRGHDVFIVQPTCPPVNDNLMELLILQDAARRASARSINPVVPYFGYARQDRKNRARGPITAKLVADMITSAGANRLLSLDLHADQVEGFFNIPIDNLLAQPVFAEDIRYRYGLDHVVVVSPDVGGVARARALAKSLDNAPLAIVDKRREAANQVEVMNIIGDVAGKTCIMIDDMIDTAGTITQGAEALLTLGNAKEVSAYTSHALFSGPAIERLNSSVLKEVVSTDSLPMQERTKRCQKLRVVSAAPLLAEALRRLTCGESLSELFRTLPPACTDPIHPEN